MTILKYYAYLEATQDNNKVSHMTILVSSDILKFFTWYFSLISEKQKSFKKNTQLLTIK